MTLTSDLDVDSAKVNQRVKCLYVIVTPTCHMPHQYRPIALKTEAKHDLGGCVFSNNECNEVATAPLLDCYQNRFN